MTGRPPALWLCVLAAAVALAGCLRSAPPAAETGPSSAGPAGTASSSAGSASLPVASSGPTPTSAPAGHVVVTVDLNRTSLKPGEVVGIRIKAANPGPGPATVSDWCNPPWSVTATGPDSKVTFAEREDTGRYCPTRGMTSGEQPPRWEMEAGGAQWLNLTWDGRTPGFHPSGFRNDVAPGPYVLTATYDGAPPGTANLTVLPAPTLRVELENQTVRQGESVTFRATFGNPTNDTLFYAIDCAGAPWDARATTVGENPDGSFRTYGVAEASPPSCGGVGRLDPGQEVGQAFTWNGTLYDATTGQWYQPIWYVYFHVAAAYGFSPADDASRSVAAWSGSYAYVCGPPQAQCP